MAKRTSTTPRTRCAVQSKAHLAPESVRSIQLTKGTVHVVLQGNVFLFTQDEIAFVTRLAEVLDRAPKEQLGEELIPSGLPPLDPEPEEPTHG